MTFLVCSVYVLISCTEFTISFVLFFFLLFYLTLKLAGSAIKRETNVDSNIQNWLDINSLTWYYTYLRIRNTIHITQYTYPPTV